MNYSLPSKISQQFPRQLSSPKWSKFFKDVHICKRFKPFDEISLVVEDNYGLSQITRERLVWQQTTRAAHKYVGGESLDGITDQSTHRLIYHQVQVQVQVTKHGNKPQEPHINMSAVSLAMELRSRCFTDQSTHRLIYHLNRQVLVSQKQERTKLSHRWRQFLPSLTTKICVVHFSRAAAESLKRIRCYIRGKLKGYN